MTDTLKIQPEETADPGVVPEGAEGDETRVTVPDTGDPPPAETKAEDRPEWLPEKFKNPEDLAKAYSELEKKLGKPADDVADDVAEAATKAGLDAEALQKEYLENRGFTKETYQKLQDAGFDKETVDSFIAGQEALAAQYEKAIVSEAGGDDEFSQMREWAKVNLSSEEIEAFDDAVTSGNTNLAKLAVRGLRASYVEANGKPGVFVKGDTAPAHGPKPFASNEEIVRAMGDPRYREDPAYRAQVAERLRVTEF